MRALLVRSGLGLLALGSMLAFAVPGALADTTSSSNWSGYAVHGRNAKFRQVSAEWRVPSVSCQASQPGYSAMWVGLGGYSVNSPALEQTGTESDCTRSGRPAYSTWWEIVPAASRRISLSVQPGQLIQAAVSVSSGKVTIRLSNLTTHSSFSRSVLVSPVDTASAEWIIEAPSECDSQGSCQTLPLADFGSAAFSSAHAVSVRGHSGSIASRWWNATEIVLQAGGRVFASSNGTAGAAAQPSALSAGGSAFRISYEPAVQAATYRAAARGYLRHPALR